MSIVVWVTTIVQAQNYGYAGSAENYQETLNHALDRAMIKLLSDNDFTSALCSCK